MKVAILGAGAWGAALGKLLHANGHAVALWDIDPGTLAATLQQADSGENPIVLRYERTAGHGFGKSTHKVIDEAADIYAFLDMVLPEQSG